LKIENVAKDRFRRQLSFQPDAAEHHAFAPASHAYVTTLVRGDLASLAWVESATQFHDASTAAEETVLVHPYYCALNFRDIMLASGRLVSSICALVLRIAVKMTKRACSRSTPCRATIRRTTTACSASSTPAVGRMGAE